MVDGMKKLILNDDDNLIDVEDNIVNENIMVFDDCDTFKGIITKTNMHNNDNTSLFYVVTNKGIDNSFKETDKQKLIKEIQDKGYQLNVIRSKTFFKIKNVNEVELVDIAWRNYCIIAKIGDVNVGIVTHEVNNNLCIINQTGKDIFNISESNIKNFIRRCDDKDISLFV